MPVSNSSITKSIHIIPEIRRKKICYFGFKIGIDVFLVEDAKVVIAVKLKKRVANHQRGCIDCYLHQLVVYYFCKLIDDDKNQIVLGDLPTMSRYWEQLQISILFPGNKFSSFFDAKLAC